MKEMLKNILETLKESLNYEDWHKVENAVEELELLQEEIHSNSGYGDELMDDEFES